MCCCFFVVKNELWMNEWSMSMWIYFFGFFFFKYFNKIYCFLFLSLVLYVFFVIDNDDIFDFCLGYMVLWLYKMFEMFLYKLVFLKKGFVY